MNTKIKTPFAPKAREPKEGETYSPPLQVGDIWINSNTNSLWVWNGKYWKYVYALNN